MCGPRAHISPPCRQQRCQGGDVVPVEGGRGAWVAGAPASARPSREQAGVGAAARRSFRSALCTL